MDISGSIIANFIYDSIKKGINKLRKDEPIHPLFSAVSRTAEKFDKIENLARTLEDWLQKKEVQINLESFIKGNQEVNLLELVKCLVQKTSFFMGGESEEKAIEIIHAFFNLLNEEYLKSGEGLVFLSQKEEFQYKQILDSFGPTYKEIINVGKDVSEMKLSLSKVSTDDTWKNKFKDHFNNLIDEARDFLFSGKAKTAKQLYKNLLKDIQKESGISNEILFRVHTNLACCELELDQANEAATHFESAFLILPENSKAIANMAIAQKLRGHPEDGLSYVEKLLKKEPHNTSGLCVKAALLVDLKRYDEAIDVFKHKDKNVFDDELLVDSQFCHTIGFIYYQKRDFKLAFDFLNRAAGLDTSNSDFLLLLALSIAVPLFEKKTLPWLMPNDRKEELKSAENLLIKAYELLKDSENLNKKASVLANRSSIRLALNDLSGTISDCDSAIIINKDNSLAYKNKGMALSLSRQFKDAINSWKMALEKGEDAEEMILLIAHCYLEKEPAQPNEAIKLIEKLCPEPNINKDNLNIKINLADCFIEKKEFEKAELLLNKILSYSPQNSMLFFEFHKYNKAIGELEEAEKNLIFAIKYGDDFESLLMSLELANYYYEQRFYDKAIPFYEKITNTEINNSVLLKYLTSLYYSVQKDICIPKCLEICKKIRLKDGPSKHITEIEAAIQEKLDNLTEASNLYKELIKIDPDKYSHKLRYGLAEFRKGNQAQAFIILNEIKDKFANDAQALISIAEFFDYVGSKKEAIELAYKALKISSNDPKINMAYIHLFLSRDDSRDKEFSPDEIDVDTVVSLKINGVKKEFTLLNPTQMSFGDNEVLINSDFGKALQGHKVGDRIKIGKSRLSSQKLEILEIKSKYVKAFQDTIQNFNLMFPKEKGITLVKVGKKLKNILKILDETAERTSIYTEQYRQGKVTIGVLSTFIGFDIFDTWAGLISLPDLNLICANGSAQEQKAQINLLNSSQKIVVDLIGLFTLAHLDCLDLLPKLFSEVYVAQSCLDELTKTIGLSGISQKKGYMTIGKKGNQYLRSEVTPRAVQNKIEFLNKIKYFIANKLKVNGITKPLLFSEERLSEIMGKYSIDTLRIAKENDVSIYSDDKYLRDLAYNEHRIGGFCIQAILTKALNSSFITEEEYNEKIIKILRSQYSSISINGKTLLYSAINNRFDLSSKEFSILINIIENKNTTLKSAVSVLTIFVKLLWLESIPNNVKCLYLDLVLHALTKERGIQSTTSMFIKNLNQALRLMPIHLSKILRYIEIWRKNRIYI